MLDLDLRIAAVLAAANELHRRFDPIQAIDLPHLVDHASDLAIDLQAFEMAYHLRTTNQLARDVDQNTIRELIGQLGTLRRLGRTVAASQADKLSDSDEPVLARALQLAFVMDLAVATDPVEVDELTRARDDFAGADLRGLKLDDVPLAGVRWSRATRWPAGWEAQVRQDSVEIASGLFEVRRDGNRRDVLA